MGSNSNFPTHCLILYFIPELQVVATGVHWIAATVFPIISLGWKQFGHSSGVSTQLLVLLALSLCVL